MSNFQSCAATAKLVRKALKEAFPGIKFSVRSHTYSMGASINVNWTDGPTDKQVKTITDRFNGATFDGMTDYKGGKVHEINGKPIHFGADFIFTYREISDSYRDKMETVWNSLDGRTQCELLNGVMTHSHGRDSDRAGCLARSLPVFKMKRSPTAESVKLIRTY